MGASYRSAVWRLRLDNVDFSNTLAVGDGAARFAATLRPEGCYVTAIDPHSTTPDVRRCGLEDLIDAPGRYTAIVYWHGLERTPRPSGEIRMATHLLRPGGSLIVSIPDPDSVQARVLGARWLGRHRPGERHHLSRRSLAALLRDNGLRVRTSGVSGGVTVLGWVDGMVQLGVGLRVRHAWVRTGSRYRLGRLLTLLVLPVAAAAAALEAVLGRTGACTAVAVRESA
ncbi:class I SAM-dependent methyltransferase [Nocardia sp. NPDC057353]|uniref:class I SAM-dependent methyltransferase n=1 Tax=Nocardia sp. NPDC057353 TaxID=3346104 RepID=UPI003632A2CF